MCMASSLHAILGRIAEWERRKNWNPIITARNVFQEYLFLQWKVGFSGVGETNALPCWVVVPVHNQLQACPLSYHQLIPSGWIDLLLAVYTRFEIAVKLIFLLEIFQLCRACRWSIFPIARNSCFSLALFSPHPHSIVFIASEWAEMKMTVSQLYISWESLKSWNMEFYWRYVIQ